jgi:hypothetical protein
MQILHPSSLPRLFACGQSSRGSLNIDEDSDAARLGSAVHAALARQIQGEIINLIRIAEEFGVAQEAMTDLAILTATGMKLWREVIAPWFRVPTAEQTMGINLTADIGLKGTADVIELFPEEHRGVIVDWKTDRKPGRRDYLPQVLGYAYLAMVNNPGITRITVALVWLRDKSITSEVITRSDADELRRVLVAAAEDPNPQFDIGDQCDYCKRRYECPALAARAQSQAAIILQRPVTELPSDPKSLREMWQMSGVLDRAIKSGREWIKEQIRLQLPTLDARIECEGGGSLGFAQKRIREIDPRKGIAVASKYMDDEGLASAVKLSRPALIKAARETAPEGMTKKAREEQFIADLQAAGAETETIRYDIDIQ